jgi:gamma-glutamylcysteine synthetase
LTHADALALRAAVARAALAAQHAGVNVLALGRELVALAANGLKTVAPDEISYLDILHQQVIEDKVPPADILLHKWHNSWAGSRRNVIAYLRAA